jgi:hypothetical protein
MLNPPPATSPLADRLAMTGEGIRASMAAEGKPKGPGAVLEAIVLKLLDTLLTLLADFKAGRLLPLPTSDAAPAEAGEEEARAGTSGAAAGRPRGLLARVCGLAWPRVWDAGRATWAVDAAARGRDGSHCESTPTPSLPRLAGEGSNGADRAVADPSPSSRIESAGKPGLKGRGIRGVLGSDGAVPQLEEVSLRLTPRCEEREAIGRICAPGEQEYRDPDCAAGRASSRLTNWQRVRWLFSKIGFGGEGDVRAYRSGITTRS